MHCLGMMGLSIAFWVGVVGLGVLAVGAYVRSQKPTRSSDPESESPPVSRG